MYNYYSRRNKTEEKKNLRKAFIFIFLSVTLIILFLVYGLPSVARFAAFLTDLRSSSSPVDVADTTPPTPPRLEPLPEFTKDKKIELKGKSEAGSEVILSINDKDEEILANSEGNFTYTFQLLDGENTLVVSSVDASGNESSKSETYRIVFDESPPELTLNKPNEGTEFFGPKERQIVLEGKTEGDASININGRLVVVDNDGSFTFATTLSQGENKFTIKAQDQAGNFTEKTITVTYEP